MSKNDRLELEALRALLELLRRGVAHAQKLEERIPEYLRTANTKFWAKELEKFDELKAAGFSTSKTGSGPADGLDNNPDNSRRTLLRRSTMAKLQDDPKFQQLVDKAVNNAIKAERKRVADGIKNLELPEGTTARAAAAIKKAVKAAVAAQD